jgi:hypothetical protein
LSDVITIRLDRGSVQKHKFMSFIPPGGDRTSDPALLSSSVPIFVPACGWEEMPTKLRDGNAAPGDAEKSELCVRGPIVEIGKK